MVKVPHVLVSTPFGAWVMGVRHSSAKRTKRDTQRLERRENKCSTSYEKADGDIGRLCIQKHTRDTARGFSAVDAHGALDCVRGLQVLVRALNIGCCATLGRDRIAAHARAVTRVTANTKGKASHSKTMQKHHPAARS